METTAQYIEKKEFKQYWKLNYTTKQFLAKGWGFWLSWEEPTLYRLESLVTSFRKVKRVDADDAKEREGMMGGPVRDQKSTTSACFGRSFEWVRCALETGSEQHQFGRVCFRPSRHQIEAPLSSVRWLKSLSKRVVSYRGTNGGIMKVVSRMIQRHWIGTVWPQILWTLEDLIQRSSICRCCFKDWIGRALKWHRVFRSFKPLIWWMVGQGRPMEGSEGTIKALAEGHQVDKCALDLTWNQMDDVWEIIRKYD